MNGRTTTAVHWSLIIRRMSDFEGQKKKLTSSGASYAGRQDLSIVTFRMR